MKFYDRKSELDEIQRISKLALSDHSRLTVITGRRRIGKTSLATRACRNGFPTVYLFTSRKNEASLCAEFSPIIARELNTFIPEGIVSFRVLFTCLMEAARNIAFNLIIDEFQEFFNINKSIFSDIQNIWDSYRSDTRMNLIVMGSVFSLMHKIFESSKEPLFGRADNIIRLTPFKTDVLKEIVNDYRPGYTNDELLATYTITGGIPRYIELLCDNTDLSITGIFNYVIRENSPFVDEGKNILIEEFGKEHASYFSILSAVSSGINIQPEIEAALGGKSIGGHLKRLIEDYGVLSRKRPILAKQGSQVVRYEITDNFLCFWFKYFERNRSMVEIGNFPALRQLVTNDYPTHSGLILERFFRQKLAESFLYRDIGAWWKPKGSQNEIDIVAIRLEKKQADVFEVKRNRKNFKPERLAKKTEHLKHKILAGYTISESCLSLEDM